MDVEKLIETAMTTAANERSRYHVTLGALIAELEKASPTATVVFDSGLSPTAPHSYRGYYSDLAFEASSIPISVRSLLTLAQDALGATFEGYKGGDFVMEKKTPLWAASYGSCGRAIVAISQEDDRIVLITKNVD